MHRRGFLRGAAALAAGPVLSAAQPALQISGTLSVARIVPGSLSAISANLGTVEAGVIWSEGSAALLAGAHYLLSKSIKAKPAGF